MSQSTVSAPDADVEHKLADYDRSRSPEALSEAAEAAALHDGEPAADPEAGLGVARARVHDWVAVLFRFKRDMDADFDPNRKLTMNIVPPGPTGNQYAPGVDPKDVKDPEMRRAYVEEIAKNQQRIKNFTVNLRLYQAHKAILEKAAQSVADAHQTLGMPAPEIAAMLNQAEILPGDRAAILAAVH